MLDNTLRKSKKPEWTQAAYVLFFEEHKRIKDIALQLGKTRETVSRFIHKFPEYETEMKYRAGVQAAYRRDYKNEWAKTNRTREMKEILAADHENAVKILSAERFWSCYE